MAANRNDNTILGTISNGQGRVIAVCGWCEALLHAAALKLRGLWMCFGYWFALVLKRQPAAATAIAPVTCRTSCSTSRHQRHQRWMSGVVVDPGTVGVV